MSNAVIARTLRAGAFLASAALLPGCTTSPTSGRTQFNILPGTLETTVPDLRFDVKTMLASGGEFCRESESPCPAREEAEKLAARISPIADRLGAVTVEFSPELIARVPRVEVFVVPNESPSVGSSAGGKIAVSSGLARQELSDTDLAFALGREFGRLAAAHHRESTSAGIAVSLVTGSPLVGAYVATSFLADLLFPMGALFKVGISLIGSLGTEQIVEASQQDEADELAGKLMIAAGYDLRELSEARPGQQESAIKIGWLPGYFKSRAKVAGMAPPPPTADEAVVAQKAPPPPKETKTISDQKLTLVVKTEVVASPNEMTSKAVAKPELSPEVEAAVPAPEMTATATTDLKPASEAKDGTVAPSPEMTGKAVASPGPPGGEVAAAAPPPEAIASAANDQEPASAAREDTVATLPEMTAKLDASQEPPPEDKVAVAAPAPKMRASTIASRRPAAIAKAGAAKPPLQSAKKPALRKKPPPAKPAAAKGTTKPPVKNRKKFQKPPKQSDLP
ncbi:MAG: M48 family metalloprotease [Rhodocyclales bacterium]|nr:M48 family metalloprotease [Rhodocyclales bacterium]